MIYSVLKNVFGATCVQTQCGLSTCPLSYQTHFPKTITVTVESKTQNIQNRKYVSTLFSVLQRMSDGPNIPIKV